MSALLSLVEAATALTQLVSPENWPPQSAPFPSASAPASTPPATSAAAPSPPMRQSHVICDDAASTNAALARMALLRENHLQALRAAPLPPAATPYRGPVTPAAGALAMTRPPSPLRHQAHAICDDAASANVALARMALLRENHLQALRAAALPAVATPYHGPVTPAFAGGRPAYPASPPYPEAATAAPLPPATTPYQGPATPAFAEAVTAKTPPAAAHGAFPLRLHALLSDPAVRDVVSWLPHGRSFVVLRPADFATRVLPRYFAPEGSNSVQAKGPGVHKYPSFTRKLNRWGFRQIARGPDAGAFCHAQFQRDLPELCRHMVCQKSRRPNRVGVSAAEGGVDDYSASSASVMGTRQCVASEDKRPYAPTVTPYSSTVTVSTAGVTSDRSLPLKKRKSNDTWHDIPSTISHRTPKWPKVPASASSVTSDTSVNPGAPSRVVPKAATRDVAERSKAVSASLEALARHFHQQRRALALASLMENSRLALRAAGPATRAAPAVPALLPGSRAPVAACRYSPAAEAVITGAPGVVAPTVAVPAPLQASATAIAAAKGELYQAYLQALSNNARSP